MTRLLLAAALLLAAGLAACDDGAPASLGGGDALAAGDATSPYGPEHFQRDALSAVPDAPTPVYPGHPCEQDDQCSTGLCWGAASSQGAFLPKTCQLACVPGEDFSKFCDSDADCCDGRCCLGCGAREGLCVQD